MIAWLTDTLIMTGGIMVLILLVRRPVGQWFGPSAAYALWALPMIRLLLPPLTLPETLAMAHAADMLMPQAQPLTGSTMVIETVEAGAAATAPTWQMPWSTIAVAVWLGGAALFLLHRAIAYRRMRNELLLSARPIGHSEKVRIVESIAVTAPVAFGVFDKVVALPAGFLANADSDASDFAITHELEHHAGNDLIANIAVQPLFALHWFNPIAWLAWRALRSDQEAACDARVMAGRSRRERERYGRLIASFAAGPRFALAAPMAGPLKGDKPIIHRLKALVRNEVPERHRAVGRSLFAAAVVAVPLTASVTYAADELEQAVPVASSAIQAVPSEPLDHERQALVTSREEVTEVSTDDEKHEAWARSERHVSNGRTVQHERPVLTPADEAEVSRSIESAMAEADQARAEAARATLDAAGHHARAMRAAADAQRIAQIAVARAPTVEQSYSHDGKVQTIRIVNHSDGQRAVTRTMVIDSGCPADRQRVSRAVANGTVSETRVCTGAPQAARHVVSALSQARASIAANLHMPSAVRGEVLSELDREIADARSEAH